jgi:hypothetical protein
VGADGAFPIHLFDDRQADARWLKRCSAHFLKIVNPRRPSERVIQLKPLA